MHSKAKMTRKFIAATTVKAEDQGLCLTLTFDWLKLVVEDATAGKFFDFVTAQGRLKRLEGRDTADRHRLNRLCLHNCSNANDLISVSTVYTGYYVDQTLNGGQGRFHPRTVRWKDWDPADKPADYLAYVDPESTDPKDDIVIQMLTTRCTSAPGKGHAMGAVYYRKPGFLSIFEPNSGEHWLTMKRDAQEDDFWKTLKKEHGMWGGKAQFAVLRYLHTNQLFGTIYELKKLGQI